MSQNSKETRYHRSQVLVDRGLQIRFTKFVLLFVFITAILTGLTVFYTTVAMLGQRLADVYPQGRLTTIFQSVHVAFFICMILILPVITYVTILFSHRIAGPLPKIYEILRGIGRGEFEFRLTLRKHDELKELVEVINEMAKNLKERESRK